uniref:Uncharacterized protein n=1 Tax=Magnetococcus massalia (strain MO-1) TaxID=451514 RepID=A0A1S7LDP2_MAGMO|nr:protein of unknown function [Candidatus Magnetococcus massalia]
MNSSPSKGIKRPSLRALFGLIILPFVWSDVARADRAEQLPHYIQPPLKVEESKEDWLAAMARIPPLKHPRQGRWPMIMWSSGNYRPLERGEIQLLLDRGLTQHLPLDKRAIPAALALQEAGSPVILLEARGGNWPYNWQTAPWSVEALDGKPLPDNQRKLNPLPTLFTGWGKAANHIRRTLRAFKKAGVTVDAIWLDWENQPMSAKRRALLNSPTAREHLPARALRDSRSFRHYRRQLWNQLMSTYVAAPAREIYPKVSITNWVITLSSSTFPVRDWYGRPHPHLGMTLFTETNPIAYAIDTFYLKIEDELVEWDQEHVNQAFTHVVLRQVSADSYNRNHYAPWLGSVPWVGRWVPDHLESDAAPTMSRSRWREALRHIWLRDINSMQIFNPIRSGYQQYMHAEVEDAVAIYDEMLAYHDFLNQGQVLNYRYPKLQDSAVLWSGLKLKERALIRTFRGPLSPPEIKLEPWKGQTITLPLPKGGSSWMLTLAEKGKISTRQLSHHPLQKDPEAPPGKPTSPPQERAPKRKAVQAAPLKQPPKQNPAHSPQPTKPAPSPAEPVSSGDPQRSATEQPVQSTVKESATPQPPPTPFSPPKLPPPSLNPTRLDTPQLSPDIL